MSLDIVRGSACPVVNDSIHLPLILSWMRLPIRQALRKRGSTILSWWGRRKACVESGAACSNILIVVQVEAPRRRKPHRCSLTEVLRVNTEVLIISGLLAWHVPSTCLSSSASGGDVIQKQLCAETCQVTHGKRATDFSTGASPAQRCGLWLRPTTFTWLMLRGSTLPVITVASRGAVRCVTCRRCPTWKTSQQPSAGQGSETRGLGLKAEIKALGCAQVGVLGKSSHKDGVCYFAYPIWFRSLDL